MYVDVARGGGIGGASEIGGSRVEGDKATRARDGGVVSVPVRALPLAGSAGGESRPPLVEVAHVDVCHRLRGPAQVGGVGLEGDRASVGGDIGIVGGVVPRGA